MDRVTQLALNRINQRFYASIAHQWQDKRKRAWPGFERIWQGSLAAVRGDADSSGHVLDVGCGDGRFAQFLADLGNPAEQGSLSYLGLDNSPALLDLARQRALGPAFCFEHADMLLDDLTPKLLSMRFQLVSVFGVLHHIPGFAQRAALLRTLAQHLSPTGRLVVTVWRLDEDPRFASRSLDFEHYNQSAVDPIDLAQLEPGDRLLRWDNQPSPRYCHFPDADELARLIASTGLHERERFRADGHHNRMNEYVVLVP